MTVPKTTLSNRTRRNRSRGGVFIEFLLILPMFLLFVLMCFDMGRMILNKGILQDATYSAARAGAQQGGASSGTDVSERTFTQAMNTVTLGRGSDLNMVVVTGNVCRISGPDSFVQLDTTYRMPFVTPGIGAVFAGFGSANVNANGYLLRGSGAARCEVVVP